MTMVAGLLTDFVLVLAYTIAIRMSHGQSLDAEGIFGTAWPFLVGIILGWFVTASWRTTLTLYAAVGVWFCALVVGFLFRDLTYTGAQPSFLAVSASVLAVCLLGWRLLVYLEYRRRHPEATALNGA